MKRQSCVIAVGEWGDSRCLLKNRDRNYSPDIRVVHDEVNGVEVLYLEDIATGWIEGMNEHGIGIVNSALLVGRDEAEKKIVKTRGKKKSKDGERIRKALGFTKIREAIKSLRTYKGGVKGHTFVSSPKTSWSMEMTSKHNCVAKKLRDGQTHVRTNHGFEHEDAGYTEGKDYLSSVVRRETARKFMDRAKKPEDLAMALMSGRKENQKHPNNVVRNTKNMFTSSQMVMDLTTLAAYVYLIEGQHTFKGVVNKLPEGRTPRITITVLEYSKDGTKTEEVNLKTSSSIDRVARAYLLQK